MNDTGLNFSCVPSILETAEVTELLQRHVEAAPDTHDLIIFLERGNLSQLKQKRNEFILQKSKWGIVVKRTQ